MSDRLVKEQGSGLRPLRSLAEEVPGKRKYDSNLAHWTKAKVCPSWTPLLTAEVGVEGRGILRNCAVSDSP